VLGIRISPLTLAVMLVAACSSRPKPPAEQTASPQRQAEVAARGAPVMPFDLSKTHHVFEDRPDGGIQRVTANDPNDTGQVSLIREHLQEEASRFARGDFEDPMAIHGKTMPGLAELRDGSARISVSYREIPGGAAIGYTTWEPALITALHRWFEAQRMDHGS